MVRKVIRKIKKQTIVKKETVSSSSKLLMVSIGPLMTIPQALQIWMYKKSAGIFIPTWITYCLVSIAWVVYAIQKNDKPLFFNALANTLLNLIIVTGAIMVRS